MTAMGMAVAARAVADWQWIEASAQYGEWAVRRGSAEVQTVNGQFRAVLYDEKDEEFSVYTIAGTMVEGGGILVELKGDATGGTPTTSTGVQTRVKLDESGMYQETILFPAPRGYLALTHLLDKSGRTLAPRKAPSPKK
jgi:hypothetical protein